MNKIEYMNSLSNNLRRLPQGNYKEAMEYYEEYFAEAGEEKEQEAIEDLGTPEMAADQIIRNFAIRNAEEPDKSMKKGLSALWIGILAVFAAPVALPLAFAFAMVGVALVIVVLALVFSVLLTAICFVGTSVIGVVGGICLLFSSPISGIATIGFSIFAIGISILITYGGIRFSKWLLKGMIKLFGKVAKGGKKDEK